MQVNDGRLWLIGGTTESATLAREITAVGIPCTVTVTTAAAADLYPQTPKLKVVVGRLDVLELDQFLQEHLITAILDASHPYAVAISQMAIATASERQIPYLRFERPVIDSQPPDSQTIFLESFATLLAGDYLSQHRVLLTVGYKALPLFRDWQEHSTLFARVLPSISSLETATASGFSADRIIALRPPITPELEKALWHQWNISLVVTKASGVAGGEDVKRAVAVQLGIPLIVITRPIVDYPRQTSNLSTALDFCLRYVSSESCPG
ncbi:cobalt-precorrin-6A reductase [Lyngbya aestuarii]|uniref:cobalt-precorrin-6A reductase n=1 Tax=Lyngbya aestuarii TaxID=118322 RepID=UPI00403D908F